MVTPLRLAFICTGNICRSPMAEVYAMAYGARRGWPVEARSGGVLGIMGKPADPLAVRVMNEIDIDLSGHRSGDVNAEMMDWAQYVLVMELHHASKLRERFPESEDKIMVLANFGGFMEIKDPIGGWRWKFRRCRDELKRCIESFMDGLPSPLVSADPSSGLE
ncbi:MAG: low molecular weight protein arginine phosphatase [Myxococcota bacterium]